jgi:hypothetical protein
MRSHPSARREQAYVVTEARQSRSAEIAQRERRYLTMMGIRIVCFAAAVAMFLLHVGWWSLIPAVGAITLPYFAVVVGNARRQTGVSSGFRPYEPRLPARYEPGQDGTGPGGKGRGPAS